MAENKRKRNSIKRPSAGVAQGRGGNHHGRQRDGSYCGKYQQLMTVERAAEHVYAFSTRTKEDDERDEWIQAEL